MNGIVGMTELALGTPLSSDQREYLDTIKESGDALLTVINDILDFSKVEAGMLELEEIEFNLDDKIRSAVQALSARARDKGLELIYHLDSAVPNWIIGDAGRLRQIIINLVGNAIKFTARGEVALWVNMLEPPKDNEKSFLLRFAVSDTGIGIPAEKQQLIFDAFSQADNSTTRQFGGTGLGLTISSRLVSLMGGKIWVESEVGHGSTFHFTARFGISEVHSDEPDTKRSHGNGILTSPMPADRRNAPLDLQPKPIRPLNILMAEDNPINQRVAQRMLRMAGHLVTVAETANRP